MAFITKGVCYAYCAYCLFTYGMIVLAVANHLRFHYVVHRDHGENLFCTYPNQVPIFLARSNFDIAFGLFACVVSIVLACIIKRGIALGPYILLCFSILCLGHLIASFYIIRVYLKDDQVVFYNWSIVRVGYIAHTIIFWVAVPNLIIHCIFFGLITAYAMFGESEEN